MARYNGTSTQRGVGHAHAADKKRLMMLHRDGDLCWRCGEPMYKWQALDRDHVIDRALGGAQGPAVLAHASCNRSKGATLGNQLRPRVIAAAGHDIICAACGQPYHYAARNCEICGSHYHPNHREQRSCGRICGVQLQRRNRTARVRAVPMPSICACGRRLGKGRKRCSECIAASRRELAEVLIAQAKAARQW